MMKSVTSPSRPVLLCGTDAEGDARELPCCTVEYAQEYARSLSVEPFAWLSWTIWHNDPAQGGRWSVHSTSTQEAAA